MQRGVYFVGGASGAGKTSSTKSLSEQYGVPVVELDEFQRLIMPAIPQSEPRAVAMRRIAKATLLELLASRSRCIVDGSWVGPDEAAVLRSEYGSLFHPVYCGYHDSDMVVRYAVLKERGLHWLTRESVEVALDFLERQRRHSEDFRESCGRLGISYIDFTSFAAGFQALETDFSRWAKSII